MPAEFDSIAHVYDDAMPEHINAHYAHKRVEFVRGLGGRGPVLDVGCGTGTLAREFKQAGYHSAPSRIATGTVSFDSWIPVTTTVTLESSDSSLVVPGTVTLPPELSAIPPRMMLCPTA